MFNIYFSLVWSNYDFLPILHDVDAPPDGGDDYYPVGSAGMEVVEQQELEVVAAVLEYNNILGLHVSQYLC